MMSSKSEKERRKKLAKDIAQKTLEQEIADMPISKSDLKDLFDLLDGPDAPPCDHTLKETLAFLENRGLDKNIIIPWLNKYGGYCDCEIIYNVDEKWGEYVGRTYDVIDDEIISPVTRKSKIKKSWWKFW